MAPFMHMILHHVTVEAFNLSNMRAVKDSHLPLDQIWSIGIAFLNRLD